MACDVTAMTKASGVTDLYIRDEYEINVDTYHKLTLPTYDLTPACNKTIHFAFFENGPYNGAVPWMNYNATADEY